MFEVLSVASYVDVFIFFDQVTITLTDGRKFLAEVKGSDELSDLAVLKIDRDIGTDPTPLPAATLGDSQELQVTCVLGVYAARERDRSERR